MKSPVHIISTIALLLSLLTGCATPDRDNAFFLDIALPKMINENDSDPAGKTDPEPDFEPKKKHGNRIPSRPTKITIIQGRGVTVEGVDKSDITAYSIHQPDGTLLAPFADDIDFANAVFAMTGTIEIRITLDGYYLCALITKE